MDSFKIAIQTQPELEQKLFSIWRIN